MNGPGWSDLTTVVIPTMKILIPLREDDFCRVEDYLGNIVRIPADWANQGPPDWEGDQEKWSSLKEGQRWARLLSYAFAHFDEKEMKKRVTGRSVSIRWSGLDRSIRPSTWKGDLKEK